MITADADRGVAVLLSTAIRLDRQSDQIAEARLRTTAHGVYEVRLGDAKVGDAVLAPGWTSYDHRLQIHDHEVTALVHDGVVIEVLLGNGWWRGGLGFSGAALDYGNDIGFVGELEIIYRDGTRQLISTTSAWSARRSDITANSLYNGQTIDARLRGRIEPLSVRVVDYDRSTLVPQEKPDITRQEVLEPERVWVSRSGSTIADFGQNLVGWIRLRAVGPAGTTVTIRHAEVLDENGDLATRPLRGAEATDRFILSGDNDYFEPTLTFHGFRYAEITGLPQRVSAENVDAVVVHSTMARTGHFSSSSPLINQLVSNSIWGQKGNFLDLPTDCPQRDERLGWTGDIAVYAPTAAYQFDVADLLHGWLLDLAVETQQSGHVPVVVPDVLKLAGEGTSIAALRGFAGPKAVWGDAAVWVPQALWNAYGDKERLAAHYPAMVAHVESATAALSDTGLWDASMQLGDWLDPSAPPDNPLAARADPGVVATACLYRSVRFVALASRELENFEAAAHWDDIAESLRRTFGEHYVGQDGTIRSDAPTVYALAIVFGLLDDDRRALAGSRLANLVRANGYTVATGFAGTPYVTWALSETGHVEDAYRLILQEECPSWLYPVTMGATTIWERWDSMLPDGSINSGEMTSFNHYAFGAVVDWLHQVVAGIRPAAPGYERVRIQPTPGPGLDWAHGTLDTRHGRIESGWKRDGTGYEMTATIPEGVHADLLLPDSTRHRLAPGRNVFRYTP